MNAVETIPGRAGGDFDVCVVETSPLCEIVRCFVADWLKTRPSMRGRRGYDALHAVDPMGPYQWLSVESEIPETVLRKIRNPVKYPLTEMRIADPVVSLISEPCVYYDGTLEVMRNPLAPLAPGEVDCCGGSMRTLAYSITSSSIVRLG